MPDKSTNIPTYTAADLLRYATGSMPASEMHALEKAAMEDEFLGEALDGMVESAQTYPQAELQKQIDRLPPLPAAKQEANLVPLWRRKMVQLAAAASLIAGIGWWLITLVRENGTEKQDMAVVTSAGQQASPDSMMRTPADTNSSSPNGQLAPSNPQTEPGTLAFEKPKKVQDPGTFQLRKLQSAEMPVTKPDTLPEPKPDNTIVKNEPAEPNLPDKDREARQMAADVATDSTNSSANRDALAKKRIFTPNQNAKAAAPAPPRYIFRGRITDEKNNPLPYANVTIPGEDIGTYTDSKGNFNFIYEDSVLPVRTRSLGYESQTLTMKPGTKEMQIIMPEDEKLKENLALTIQPRRQKQAGYQPLIVETDSLASAQPVVSIFDYNLYILNNNRISEIPQSLKRVELSFEVDQRGEVKNITVEQSSGKAVDDEAIRLLKEGPRWKPKKGGTGKGKIIVKF